jgi:hypothetical protein
VCVWGGRGHYFGSENLGVEAVAVVDLRPHCEDFASQNQLNNVIYPTAALQGVAGCKWAANCYFPSSLHDEMRAQIPKFFFPRYVSALFSQKVPGINACIYCWWAKQDLVENDKPPTFLTPFPT